MRKYCVLGIAALAFLHPAEGHIHSKKESNGRFALSSGIDMAIDHNRGSQISRRELEMRQQRCPKQPPTTTTVTIHVDEFGHTLDANPSTPVPSASVSIVLA
jgi:hypothetical protein